jgi:hypothetical protein
VGTGLALLAGVNEVDVGVLILTVRGQRVILSSDLAAVYGVQAKVLNQAVARNRKRFPPDFAFRMNWREVVAVQRSRSQFVTLKRGHNVKHRPLAFTEHGAIMAASVLNSSKAVQMSVFVVRAFVRLRQMIANQSELTSRLDQLERRVGGHDREIARIIQTIRQLVAPRPADMKRIGFNPALLGRRRIDHP